MNALWGRYKTACARWLTSKTSCIPTSFFHPHMKMLTIWKSHRHARRLQQLYYQQHLISLQKLPYVVTCCRYLKSVIFDCCKAFNCLVENLIGLHLKGMFSLYHCADFETKRKVTKKEQVQYLTYHVSSCKIHLNVTAHRATQVCQIGESASKNGVCAYMCTFLLSVHPLFWCYHLTAEHADGPHTGFSAMLTTYVVFVCMGCVVQATWTLGSPTY